MGEVLHGSLLQLLLEHCDFLNIDISQDSVATRFRCGGIFKCELVANLPMSLPVKEFWKSVNIWGSYGQEFCVLFFSRHSVDDFRLNSSLVPADVRSNQIIQLSSSTRPSRSAWTAHHSSLASLTPLPRLVDIPPASLLESKHFGRMTSHCFRWHSDPVRNCCLYTASFFLLLLSGFLFLSYHPTVAVWRGAVLC